jgi:muramoyltetrapeptide carboxypeptidase
MSVNKPSALRPGDTIGIVAPGEYPRRNSELLIGRERLEQAGFRVRVGAHVANQYGYLAGTDEQRADDFNAMLRDPDVRAILTWGSIWGAARLLPLIDYAAAQRDPKIVVGCGNTSALLNALHERAGLVVFHGAAFGALFRSDYTYNGLIRAMTAREPLGSLGQPTDRDYPPLVPYVSGQARGVLVGGSMGALALSLGTLDAIVTDGRIVLLEAREVKPEMLSRYLTVLTNSGKLPAAAGIVVAECVDCVSKDTYNTFSLEGVLEDRLLPLRIPSLYGLRLGQGDDQATIPFGVQSALDAEARTLVIEESALA